MESYEYVYKTVCRLCLKRSKEENMMSLINNSSADGLSDFGKAVLTFANIVIKQDDIFPTSMCRNCLCHLKQAIYFKFKCETSEKQLRKLTNFCFSEKEIHEKVVEYTLFSDYFSNEDLHENNLNTITNPENSLTTITKSENSLNTITKSENSLNTITKSENKLFTNRNSIINNDSEAASSQDSFGDHFKIDCNHANEAIAKKENEAQEDEDILLDKIEKLIGTHSEVTQTDFKLSFKRRSLNRHKKLARRRQLQKLRNRHIENESFVCNVCHRVLANKHSYENHMQRHNGCRYVCEHCGKGFPVLAELHIHQVAVHGTGPYLQCRHCPYKAPRKFSLIEHERIHTGERPYTCEKCGLTFRRRFIWKKHLIYHNEKTVQCNLCPRKFYLRSEMLAHANNVHERMYVYLCNKCGATYAKPATVRRHLTERHGVPREMQGKVIRINKGKGDFPE